VFRHGGHFYVYNSVDATSLQAPEPKVCSIPAHINVHDLNTVQIYERVVNVAVASSTSGETVILISCAYWSISAHMQEK
jgi:hypothetical protein